MFNQNCTTQSGSTVWGMKTLVNSRKCSLCICWKGSRATRVTTSHISTFLSCMIYYPLLVTDGSFRAFSRVHFPRDVLSEFKSEEHVISFLSKFLFSIPYIILHMTQYMCHHGTGKIVIQWGLKKLLQCTFYIPCTVLLKSLANWTTGSYAQQI